MTATTATFCGVSAFDGRRFLRNGLRAAGRAASMGLGSVAAIGLNGRIKPGPAPNLLVDCRRRKMARRVEVGPMIRTSQVRRPTRRAQLSLVNRWDRVRLLSPAMSMRMKRC